MKRFSCANALHGLYVEVLRASSSDALRMTLRAWYAQILAVIFRFGLRCESGGKTAAHQRC